MNPNNQNPTLGQPSTPEEDIALQAIESLDVEGSPETTAPKPTTSETPISTQVTNADPAPSPIVSNPISDIKAMPPTSSKQPTTPSPATEPVPSGESNALSATNAEPTPVTNAFQPFAQQKPTHNPVRIVLIVVLVLVFLGAAAYFGWQYFL